MNTSVVPDFGVVDRRFTAAQKLPTVERLGELRQILNEITKFELAACRDFGIPFDTVRQFKSITPEVQQQIGRLERSQAKKS